MLSNPNAGTALKSSSTSETPRTVHRSVAVALAPVALPLLGIRHSTALSPGEYVASPFDARISDKFRTVVGIGTVTTSSSITGVLELLPKAGEEEPAREPRPARESE